MSRSRLILPVLLLIYATPMLADEAPRTVNVSGFASVTTVPDMARVNMAIQDRSPDMDTARRKVVEVTQAFLDFCAQQGIKREDIRTTGLTVRPEYRWDNQARDQELTGYLVQRQLEVELDDLEMLGDVLEGAVDLGVNQVSPPVLDSSRRRELLREAMAAAAQDARSNADTLAGSLGARLGAIRNITAQDGGIPPPQPLVARAMVAEADAGATYETGEIRIEARVNAGFDLLVD